MAYFYNLSQFATTVFHDDMSGTPDNWTDNGTTHSFIAGRMIVADDAVGASENCYSNQSATNSIVYVRFPWQYTALVNIPIVFQYANTSFVMAVAFYVDSTASGSIFARNGAGWTDTGVDIAISTDTEVEFYIDRGAGTYKLYFNGSLINTYSIDTTGSSVTSRLVIGGGNTVATWTYSIGEMWVKEGLATGPANLKSYNTNVKANIKTMNTNPITNVKTFDTNA